MVRNLTYKDFQPESRVIVHRIRSEVDRNPSALGPKHRARHHVARVSHRWIGNDARGEQFIDHQEIIA